MPDPFYVTGGTLRPDAPSYVERAADRELFDALRQGEFCYVLTSRQMGKSSLMVRTAARLREAGGQVAILDLTAIGQNLSPEQWYGGLLRRLGRQLDSSGDLEDELDDYWQEHSSLGPLQRWMAALESVVLSAVTLRSEGRGLRAAGTGNPHSAASDSQPSALSPQLVIFVDEIDAVRSLPFSTDEFFAGIRECYNRRPQDPRFERLTFCLLGVATPSDLIRDVRMTPFNIGRRIELTDFTAAEAAPLALGLALPHPTDTTRAEPTNSARQVLERVLYWTGGHPYLTQRLCHALTDSGQDFGPNLQSVDRLCEALFLSRTAREKDDNLLFVRERILRSEGDLAGLLDLYAQVRAGKRIRADETNALAGILRLAGITRLVEGYLLVRNRIYYRVFDREWVLAHMPDAELRRQRSAYRQGLLRAALVGGTVIGVMALLVAKSARDERVALDASRRAEVSASRMSLALLRQQQAYKALARLATEATLQRARASQAARRAGSEAVRANLQARLARNERSQAELARRRADENARAARLQQRVAEAATGRERAAARRALELLSQGQAERGVRLLTEGQSAGLLDLLAARKTVRGMPAAEASRNLLWAGWQAATAGRLVGVMGHRLPIINLQFSPDGPRVVTVGMDGRAQFWDTATGSPRGSPVPLVSESAADKIGENRATGFGVLPLAFSPRGNRLASAFAGRVRVWDTETGTQLHVMDHPGVAGVAFARSGRRLVTLGVPPPPRSVEEWQASGATLRTWDPERGTPEGAPVTLKEPGGGPVSVSAGFGFGDGVMLSGDGRFAAANSTQHRFRVWNTATGRARGRPCTGPPVLFSGALSSDGSLLAFASQNEVQVWSPDTGETLGKPIQQYGVIVLAFSPDGRFLATGSLSGTARVWEVATGEPVGPAIRHQGFVSCLAFDPSSQVLATGSTDTTGRLWSVRAAGSPGEAISDDVTITYALSPTGRFLACCAGRGVRVWDLRTRTPALANPLLSPAPAVLACFSGDERLLAASTGQSVSVWDRATGELRAGPFPTRDYCGRVLLNRDGSVVAALTYGAKLYLWSTLSGKPMGEPRENQTLLQLIFGAAKSATPFSPDGARILVQTREGDLELLDAHTGNPLGGPLGPRGAQHAAFSPDGRLLAVAKGARVGLWSVLERRRVGREMEQPGAISLLNFSPDGTKLSATCSDAGGLSSTSRLWDVATQRPGAAVPGGQENGLPMLFSPDGALIATSARDGLVRIWNARTGAAHGQPLRLPGYGLPLLFGPRAAFLLTECIDGSIQFWDTATGQPFGPPLNLGSGALAMNPGNGVALTPDGTTLLVLGEDRRVRTWRLPSAALPIREMELATWVTLGARLGEQGAAEQISWQEWRKLREELASDPHGGPLAAAARTTLTPPGPPPPPGEGALDLSERLVPRDPKASPTLLDLTDQYNAALTDDWHGGNGGNSLAELPRGRARFGPVEFEVRGIVQLAGASLGAPYPRQVRDIRVGRACKRIEVLHATAFKVLDGTRIGSFVLNYADGHRWEIPIVYGRDVRDWWELTDPERGGAVVAWTGTNAASRASGGRIRLFRSSWESPLSGVPVESVEYVSERGGSAPFLVAITVE